jgi:hypothetical protein
MKRILLLVLILSLILPSICFAAALDADTVWEIRYDATALNVNGAGFSWVNLCNIWDATAAVAPTFLWRKSANGTNEYYLQVAAAKYTDLVIDGTLNTKVTSASHNFIAEDVGAYIPIVAGTGFTTGVYRIASVASNAATLDRAVGTLSSTGGSFYFMVAKASASPLGATGFTVVPTSVYLNGFHDLVTGGGTLGSLTAGTWGTGDNDTLGYNTLYVRLADDSSPDTNRPWFVGSGYNGGTDYSQALTCLGSWVASSAGVCAQTNYFNHTNDLASTSASSWLTLTSATGTFTAAMVGNLIHITAGTNFSPGWYKITAYTNANTVTLNSACGTTADASAGTGRIGGASSLNSTLDQAFLNAFVAGNIAYMKYDASSILMGQNSTNTVAGTAAAPIWIIGYNTTRGESTRCNPFGTSTCPTWDAGTNTFQWNASYWVFKNLYIKAANANGFYLYTGTNNIVQNVKVYNSSASNYYALRSGSNGNRLLHVEAQSTNGTAIFFSGSARIHDFYAHDSVSCVNLTGSVVLTDGIIANCSSVGLTFGTSSALSLGRNLTIYGGSSPTGTGVSGGALTEINLINSIISGWVIGIKFTTNTPDNYFDYNAFWNNTVDLQYANHGLNDQILVATPFAGTPSAGDFSPAANVKGKGFPGVFPGGLSTGYLPIGAVVPSSTGGGGGAWSF